MTTVLERFLSNNDMLRKSPIPCDLKIGDVVVFTNEYGIAWANYVVIGFAKPEDQVNGGFIHICASDGSASWFPHKREELTRQGNDTSKQFTVTYSDGITLTFASRHNCGRTP